MSLGIERGASSLKLVTIDDEGHVRHSVHHNLGVNRLPGNDGHLILECLELEQIPLQVLSV